jgi:hypothetical protein
MCLPQVSLGSESPTTTWLWTSELEIPLHARTSSVTARYCRGPRLMIRSGARLASDDIKADRAERWLIAGVELGSNSLVYGQGERLCVKPRLISEELVVLTSGTDC